MNKGELIRLLNATDEESDSFDEALESVDDEVIRYKLECYYYKLLNEYQLLAIKQHETTESLMELKSKYCTGRYKWEEAKES